ncbi:uncharacterized protein LOC109804371 [Cajanus cajan]|uniref:Uncharacterized protein n=1 Tax=Cajanus cajan TaxID=3821 RepID=A0A151T4N3_CAJCA|nr:uncharacterized protein LOC109804371 [Cajanus cajan]KYP61994.1 hypothetical protein KK1_016509 [Cajanus cajan]
MDSSASHVPASETTPFWTDEKHLRYLHTMEASFVRAMFKNRDNSTRLDRYLPDTSESTLDLKPHSHRGTVKHHAPSDSMGPINRRRRSMRRSSQPYNSSQDQVVPQVENEREGAACKCNGDDDKRAEN